MDKIVRKLIELSRSEKIIHFRSIFTY